MEPGAIQKSGYAGGLILLILLALPGIFGSFLNAQQVVDEYCQKDTVYSAMGGGGTTRHMAQSFRADVDTLNSIAVWMERLIVPGQVRLGITSAVSGVPDTSNYLYLSPALSPQTTGALLMANGISLPLQRDSLYFFVITTQNITFNSGSAIVGLSLDSTDSGEEAIRFLNGGLAWDTLSGKYLALEIKGKFCYVDPGITPLFAAVCEGTPVQVSADSGFVSYLWNTGDTTRSIVATEAGEFEVTVRDTLGCMGTANMDVLMNPNPQVNFGADDSLCIGDSLLLQAPAGPYSYAWNPPSAMDSFWVRQSGTWSLVVTDTFSGCAAGDTLTLVFHPSPSVSLPADTGFCEGGSITLDPGPGYASYLWQNGQSTRSLFVTESDTCFVTVTNAAGCSTTSSSCIVSVHPLPPRPQLSLTGNTLMVISSLSLSWYRDGNLLNQVSGNSWVPDASGEYYVLGTDTHSCMAFSDTLRVTVELSQSSFPGGISPNGDGLNDRFEIRGGEFFPSGRLRVFNRWGNEVFYQENYSNTWDGKTSEGTELPDGVYYFLFDSGEGTDLFKGSVILNR